MRYSSQRFLTLQSQFLFAIAQAIDRLGLFNLSLRPDDLIAKARTQAALFDFGEWQFREPLAVLLKAYEEEANLSAFGRVAVRWDMIRFLSNLLRLREEEKREPAILAETIAVPIFVLGLPRSGTTFLHNLLAQDPSNMAPLAWQTIYPYPLQDRSARRRDRRATMIERQFSSFVRLVPELPSLHPLDAYAAQECIEITGHVMRSLRFDTTHYVPSYEKWLDREGHLEAYRFHKRFLQHLQHQAKSPGVWVLKSPDHIYAMDALLEVYPDARFIFVHRDPLKVMASVARLTEILRAPFTRRIDRLQIGRQVTDRWVDGSKLLIAMSERFRSSPERIFHVRYEYLAMEPVAAIAAIYERFGRSMSERAKSAFMRKIVERPNGGYGQNHYTLQDYGIDPAVERRRFAPYVEYFRIEPERVKKRKFAGELQMAAEG